ncbi:uncharacterized protein [Salminus brasiliensis]|uniref:uncharacterized protein n=1 Tax=Salminus brasiliensis TaxID=930266 RepID=UPI003B832CAC
MASSHLHPKLDLHLRPPAPETTSSKSTGTDLSMEDIRHLEDLQREIRQLREEVALLEAKLRLKEGGGEAQLTPVTTQRRAGCGGDPNPEGVPRLPPLFKPEPNPRVQKSSSRTAEQRRAQAKPAGRGVPHGLTKTEPVELSHCVYATGLKTTTPDTPTLSLQCYTDSEAQDIGHVDADALQQAPSLSLHCYSDPHPGEALDSELSGGEPGGLQDSGVKTESVLSGSDDGDQGEMKTCSVRLVDCKDMLEVDGNVKEEEELDGYREEDFIAPAEDVAMQEDSRPSTSDDSIYGPGTCLSGPMTSHFITDEHFNGYMDKEEPCSCFWCGKRFLSPSMLRIHLSTHEYAEEGSPAPAASSAKVLQLQLHGKELPVRDKLYPCIHCGKTFTDLSHCKSHEKIHTGEGPYRCNQCGVSFAFLYGLQNHQKEHAEEPGAVPKPYQCSFCQKQFATKATLIIHQRVHTGERPYQCFFCDQAFTRSDRLKEHERIHTGEKPYQCNSCGKQFSQSASFRTHQRIHTGEKPYSCSTCGKQFSDLTGLRTHERQHTGEKPYHCFQCGKSFAQASNLRAHHKRHATEQNPLMFSI